MPLPPPKLELGNDDTNSIESDIDELYAKFISPIEKIRSFTSIVPDNLAASQKSTVLGSLSVGSSGAESRCHAFYRLLGLPVVDSQGRLYSSGFNPSISNQTVRDGINSSQDSVDLNSAVNRENWVSVMQSIFPNQDTTASVYSLMIGLHPKPFNNLGVDAQTYSVPDRTLELAAFQLINTNLATQLSNTASTLSSTVITGDLDGGQHILYPFTVNPLVDFAVMPVNNLIAAPFLLDVNATRSSASPEVLHLRPGIEFILRQRLQDTTPDPDFLNNLVAVLSAQNVQDPTFTASLDVPTLTDTLFAFADQNNISSIDVNKIFQNLTTTEANMVEQLIKLLKNLITLLRDSISNLEKIRGEFNFIPVPSKFGPENIGTISDALATSKLDVQILQLTIKQLNGDSGTVADANLGDFASPFTASLEKTPTYSDQLKALTQKRNKIGNLGLQALRTIEIITGEVSGLGLVDIIAIYLALWSMDLSDVLGLLDQDAFNRLYNNNPTLQVGPVAAKSASSVTTALQNMKQTVSNILSFADKLLTDSLSASNQTDTGDV